MQTNKITQRKQIRRPISKVFPVTHERCGEETNFLELITYGGKIHTVRYGFEKWKKIVDKVNAGTHVLVLYNWEDKPYNSKQVEIARFYSLGIETLNYVTELMRGINSLLSEIAENDGLSFYDFVNWFSSYDQEKLIDMAIIHFTDFKYFE